MKSCRHCWTEIHENASICFECGNSQTWLGSMKGLFLTIFPIVTAVVSLGLAMAEKIERQNVSAELKVETERAEAATEAVVQLTEVISPEMIEQTYEETHGEKPSVERLERIKKDVDKMRMQPSVEVDKQQLIHLQGEKLLLEKLKARGQLDSRSNARTSMNPTLNRLPLPPR